MTDTLKIRRVPVLAARYSDDVKWMTRFRNHVHSFMIGGGRNWFEKETVKRRQWIMDKTRSGANPESTAEEFLDKFYPAGWTREFPIPGYKGGR